MSTVVPFRSIRPYVQIELHQIFTNMKFPYFFTFHIFNSRRAEFYFWGNFFVVAVRTKMEMYPTEFGGNK